MEMVDKAGRSTARGRYKWRRPSRRSRGVVVVVQVLRCRGGVKGGIEEDAPTCCARCAFVLCSADS